jgi:hypothetical protein
VGSEEWNEWRETAVQCEVIVTPLDLRLASYRMGIQAAKLQRLYDMEAKILAFVATADCAAAFNRLSA